MFDIRIKKSGPFFDKNLRDQVVDRMLRSTMNEAVSLVHREVALRTPRGYGVSAGLLGSIGTDVRGSGVDLQGIVGTPIKYAPVRELGRGGSTRWPDMEALENWVGRKTGKTGTERRRIAYRIAIRIMRSGYKGAFFFKAAFEASQRRVISLFEKWGVKVVSRLS